MANGTILFDASGALQGRIVWNSNCLDADGNYLDYSVAEATIQARRIDGYTTYGQSWSGFVKIGTTQADISFSSSVSVGSAWVTMKTLSGVQITHEADGSKTINISGSVTGPTGTSLAGVTSSGNQNVTLDKIPRASTVTCADGNIGSSTTININRAYSGFTHTLKYNFGSLSGTIVTKTSEVSYGWNIPTTFFAQIPNSNSGQGTITCETYQGNDLIGTSTATFNAFVVNSNPTITATIVDDNATTKALTGDENKLIKYYSNAKVTITATALNSATIISKRVTCEDGKSSTSSPATLYGVESGKFNLTCTDSRGNVGTNTITKTMVDYIKLAITSLTIQRTGSTSNTVTINLSGQYFNNSFGSVANTLTLKWRYREKGGTWGQYATVTATKSGNTFTYSGTLGTNFDYQSEYEFEVVAQDKLVTDTKTKNVTAGIPLIDIWKGNIRIEGNLTVSRDINGTVTNATKATIADEPNGKTWRSIYFGVNDTGNQALKKNNGIMHYSQDGTEDALGYSFLQLGNAIAEGTAGNKKGILRLYGNGAYYHQLESNATGNRVITLPDYAGTLQVRPTNLYNNSSGTTGTVTLSSSAANFNYLEIFYGKTNGTNYSSVKVYSPNNKTAILNLNWRIQAGSVQIQEQTINISGTSIARNPESYTNIYNNGSIDGNDQTDITIFRVDGYK